MTAKNRDQTLDAIKGVAIFLVMVGHVLNLNHMEDPYVYDGIRAVQMPLFMMVSGYLCGLGRPVRSLGEYGAIMKRRAISYLVPFFVWIVVLYPLELPGAIWDTLFHLDYGLWFLMTLFLLTAMVHTAQLAASLAGERAPLRELLFWAAYGGMAVFVVAETLVGWEFLSPSLTRMYLPFYLAGYVATAYGRRLSQQSMRQGQRTAGGWGVSGFWGHLLCNLGALACAGIFFYLLICYDLTDLGSVQAFFRQTLASFTGCYLIFWLCRRWPSGRTKQAFAWLGGYTLEIYALHFHFATLLNQGQAYGLYSLQGLLFAGASFVAMSLITAGIIAVTKKVPLLDFLLYGKGK
ncbi:MAG: acyltransferase [Lachnospiraceae bacterium]|nr:acyltransferase [Lachnospiraceae bacterium]